jgi:hypothetical protein
MNDAISLHFAKRAMQDYMQKEEIDGTTIKSDGREP